MKVSSASVLFVASIAATTNAFSSTAGLRHRFLSSSSSSSSSTARYFLDTSGTNKQEATGPVNPLMDVAAFLSSPKPVEARTGLSGQNSHCLVSGNVPDEFFYHLHTNDDENKLFDFESIIAVNPDVNSMKKKLLTRQARYTGLLDKLDYAQGGLLPPSDLLEKATSWVVFAESSQDLQDIATVANQVDNVVVMYLGNPQLDDMAALMTTSANPNASIVIVQDPEWLEINDLEDPMLTPSMDNPLLYYPQQEVPPGDEQPSYSNKDSSFLKAETLRLVAECLQLKAAAGKSLYVTLMENTLSTKVGDAGGAAGVFPNLVKGLRQAGYARPQEIDYILSNGLEEFVTEVENFEKEHPTNSDGSVKMTNAWWEDPEFQKLVKESSLRKDELKQANRLAEEKAQMEYEEGRFS